MKYRIIAFLFCFGLLDSVALAGSWVSIQNYELWSNTYNDDRIRITGITIQNPELCLDADSYMVHNGHPDAIKDRIYSALLSALISGKSIEIYIDGCESNRPRIKNVKAK